MLALVLPPVSSHVSGLPVASPCLLVAAKHVFFVMLLTVKIGGSLVQNAFFCLHVFCGVAMSMGEAIKPLLF